MGRRAGVVPEARQGQLLGDAVAARDRPPFQHEAAVSGLGEIGGRDQAVVACAGNHDVELFGHVRS